MTRLTEKAMTAINETYNEVINKTIKRVLGVEVNMKAVNENGRVEDTIKTDVNKKMRGNKILRTLFKDAELYGYAYELDKEPKIGISISTGYSHNDGGSNGHSLIIIYINTETGKVKVLK